MQPRLLQQIEGDHNKNVNDNNTARREFDERELEIKASANGSQAEKSTFTVLQSIHTGSRNGANGIQDQAVQLGRAVSTEHYTAGRPDSAKDRAGMSHR
jgi:hypothetical protein